MKRVFAVLALLVAGFVGAHAQNVQIHYNLGPKVDKANQENDQRILTTFEHLSFDKWGENFYFVDLAHSKDGQVEAYAEISRELRFWKAPIYAHLEYNGGLGTISTEDGVSGYRIPNVYLAGASYIWAKEGNAFKVSMLYRHDRATTKRHNMQMTTVWSWTSWNRVFTLNGFADVYTVDGNSQRNNLEFIAEPQFWINLNQFVGVADAFNLSLGGEVRMAYNFLHNDKFWVRPSLAAKWTF